MTTILPATEPQAFVADVLLVRYCMSETSPKKVLDDINKLVPHPLTAEAFDDLRTSLLNNGLLGQGKRKAYKISDLGRERALRFLGLSEWPKRLNWSQVIGKYLLSQAIDLEACAVAKMTKGEQLAAFVLKRQYDLPGHSGNTPTKVIEALACKLLGHPEETTLGGLLLGVLNQHMQTGERLEKKDLAKQLPLFGTGLNSTKADAIRRQLVREWLTQRTKKAPDGIPPEPFDLASFANTVLALARSSPPEDRFYGNKVFIAPLWRTSQRETNFPRLTLADFKNRLIEANTKNLLPLSRADLVSAMDPVLVAESETTHLGALFHFVLLEEPRR